MRNFCGAYRDDFCCEEAHFRCEEKPFGGEETHFRCKRKPFRCEEKPFGNEENPFRCNGKPFGGEENHRGSNQKRCVHLKNEHHGRKKTRLCAHQRTAIQGVYGKLADLRR